MNDIESDFMAPIHEGDEIGKVADAAAMECAKAGKGNGYSMSGTGPDLTPLAGGWKGFKIVGHLNAYVRILRFLRKSLQRIAAAIAVKHMGSRIGKLGLMPRSAPAKGLREKLTDLID